MRKLVQRHQGQILGVLSGFDRIGFRGTLRLLQSEGGVATWLERIGVAVKDFLSFVEGLTKRFCRQTDRLAEAWGRKVRYLPGVVDKEDLVQEIREQERLAGDLPRVLLVTNKGEMELELFEDEAPNTVANFVSLVEKGYFKEPKDAFADYLGRNGLAYAERQKMTSWRVTEADGTVLGQQVTPLDRVGLYVPGGKAAYPSSVWNRCHTLPLYTSLLVGGTQLFRPQVRRKEIIGIIF